MDKEVHTLSDKEILKRSLSNPRLFSVLVERYQKVFLRKAGKIIYSPDVAEDIVQDTFVKIYKNGHTFVTENNYSFSSWAYKILLNTCYSYYAKQKRQSVYLQYFDFATLDISGVVDMKFESSDRRSIIDSLLKKMPYKLSRILKMYFFEGKSQKEIARLENISPGAVRVRMFRAKKYLKTIGQNII